MSQGCANTLLNLASDPGRELEIVQCGSVSVLLITALVASDSDDTRHACTKAMTNLLCEKKVTEAESSQNVQGCSTTTGGTRVNWVLSDPQPSNAAVSYTHLTLPTICSV